MGGQGAFGWLPDISRMGFSSVLWVGPPNASPLWSGLTARRDPGTPQVRPRYDNGRTVRFSEAASAAEIAEDTAAPWEGTSGPVPAAPVRPDHLVVDGSAVLRTGLAGRIARNRPDCLDALVSDHHVLAGGRRHHERPSVPAGHGHNYGESVLDGWAAVAPPEGGRLRTPSASGSRWRRPRPTMGPNTDAVHPDSRGGAGRGPGRLERSGRPRLPARWQPLVRAGWAAC